MKYYLCAPENPLEDISSLNINLKNVECPLLYLGQLGRKKKSSVCILTECRLMKSRQTQQEENKEGEQSQCEAEFQREAIRRVLRFNQKLSRMDLVAMVQKRKLSCMF